MNRLKLTKRVRSLTRDFSNSIFREEDIHMYIDESIDRIKQVIDEMGGMAYLEENEHEPMLLPSHYHYLLAVYATSRCFGQDERHYQATTYMNEFETKLDELKQAIESGRIVIKDADGNVVETGNDVDYVNDNYYDKPGEAGTDNTEYIIVESDKPRDILYWSDLDSDGV